MQIRGVLVKRSGVNRALYVPGKLDEQVERTRARLGMSRNAFYRYAATRLLQELSVLSEAVRGDGSGVEGCGGGDVDCL